MTRSALRACIAALLFSTAAHGAEVNLYTTREPGLIQPLLDQFTQSTGIAVNTVFMKDGLPERVAAEGAHSPADVLMAADFGTLADIVDRGLAQPLQSAAIEQAVPATLRAPDGRWIALSMRARALYVSKDRVDLSAFRYEDLADPQWKGRICIRSGQHPYNTALVAAHIAHHGEEKTEAWLRAVKENLGRRPAGGDREVARDILGQLCDIGIANTYYVGRMRSGAGGPEQQQWGDAIDVVLPTFAGGGTHVAVSGASIAAHAPHRNEAQQLLEYLVSEPAQQMYAQADYEYPVRAGVAIDPIVNSFGTLTPDPTPLTEIAKHRKTASMLVEKVGFDD
jgi:iron(III) transport system substrate-binding protein